MNHTGVLLDEVRIDPVHVVNHREQTPIDRLIEEVQEYCLACRTARGKQLKSAMHQVERLGRTLLRQAAQVAPHLRGEYVGVLLMIISAHRGHALTHGWHSGLDWLDAAVAEFRK